MDSNNRDNIGENHVWDFDWVDKVPGLPEWKADQSISKEKPMRSAIICVLGHVDVGKTKLLDKLRGTDVQDGEAGGITQQIGATNVPIEEIRQKCKMVPAFQDLEIQIPGLLIIDTPGHSTFSNLRSRGTSLCDIAILVVDIMHGLEPQTIESINLLKASKTPFVIALNKIDRISNWQSDTNKDIEQLINSQPNASTKDEFWRLTNQVICQMAEQGLNAVVSFKSTKKQLRTFVQIVPVSAITGDGMGNLFELIIRLTQKYLTKAITNTPRTVEVKVLEVKPTPGYGTTIDVIVKYGSLHEGDIIVLPGFNGPIVTKIRSLLLPHPMKELRVANKYFEPKVVRATQGVKIVAQYLDEAIGGTNLIVAHKSNQIELCKQLVSLEIFLELQPKIDAIKGQLENPGVHVNASTLGSLEALLGYLKEKKIPVNDFYIGPVGIRQVKKVASMDRLHPEFAAILAFDVQMERGAAALAESKGVRIFKSDIVYHIVNDFINYGKAPLDQRLRKLSGEIICTCDRCNP